MSFIKDFVGGLLGRGPKIPGPSEEEKATKEVSIAQWNDYYSRFVPAEAELIRRSELTAGERASVKGQVAGDVASSFAGLTRGTLAAGESSGADASSGKTKFALASNADARGRALGLGQAAAETGAEATRDQQQAGLTALGRSGAAEITSDLSRAARRTQAVSLATAAAKWERNQAWINTAAVIAGAGTRKYQLHKEKTQRNAKIDAELGFDSIFFDEKGPPVENTGGVQTFEYNPPYLG